MCFQSNLFNLKLVIARGESSTLLSFWNFSKNMIVFYSQISIVTTIVAFTLFENNNSFQ